MTDPKESSSEALCAMIVAYRSLGLFKDQAKEAMSELSSRKDSGDDFDYESFITRKMEDVPKPEMNPEVSRFLTSLSYLGNTK